MAFDFSTLVTDRTQQDVAYVKQLAEKLVTGIATEAEKAEWKSFALKGAYNYTDLNRVTAAMEDLKLRLEGYGYAVPGYQKIEVPHPVTGGGSKLPEGYMELSWIESTGTQYIDTGFKPNQDTKVTMDVESVSGIDHVLFSARTSASSKAFEMIWSNSGGYYRFYYNNGNVNMDGLSASPATRRVITVDKNTATIDGYSVSRTYAAFQTDCNMVLLARNTIGTIGAYTTGKLYSCQIYDNGTLVRDYIPCISSDGVVGLYDLVTATFFGNNGTGSFVAGAIPRELPEGYTQVEYIESSAPSYTSGQRIDTKFVSNSNTRVVCDFQFTTTTSSFQALLGSRSSSANRFCLWLTNGGLFRSDYNTSNLSFSSSLSATERHTLDFNKNVCSIDGSVVTHSAGTFDGVCNLYLFASNTGGTADIHGNVRIYSCHIYDNGTLVRDYVPCKNPSGAYGLYDMANGLFYQNAGSGAFTAGEEVVAPATASVMVTSDNVAEYDPYTWYEFDWPTPETMSRYLSNISVIRSVLSVIATTPNVPLDAYKLIVSEANDIEVILLDVYRQLTIMLTTFIPCGEALCGGDNL